MSFKESLESIKNESGLNLKFDKLQWGMRFKWGGNKLYNKCVNFRWEN
mgnify:CR=1 FL=1